MDKSNCDQTKKVPRLFLYDRWCNLSETVPQRGSDSLLSYIQRRDSPHRWSGYYCNCRCGRSHNHWRSPHARRSTGNNYCESGRSQGPSRALSYDTSHNLLESLKRHDSGWWRRYIQACGSRHRYSVCCCNYRCDKQHSRSQLPRAPL